MFITNWLRRQRQRRLYNVCRLILEERGERSTIPATTGDNGIPYPPRQIWSYCAETWEVENIGLLFPVICVFSGIRGFKGRIVFWHDWNRCERHNSGTWEDEVLALERQIRDQRRREYESRFEPIR